MPRVKLLREWEAGGRKWRLQAEVRGQLWEVYLLRGDGRAWTYADAHGQACPMKSLIERHVHKDSRDAVQLGEEAEKLGKRAAAEWARTQKPVAV